ncbi:hypothetical protein R1flu_028721 [Riccia fluitans]|uniref:Uncharacterized protein n=1 Tax=Riccia fluitans TaxID=41844 RepID=A0ABD1XMH1_9MARC
MTHRDIAFPSTDAEFWRAWAGRSEDAVGLMEVQGVVLHLNVCLVWHAYPGVSRRISAVEILIPSGTIEVRVSQSVRFLHS